MTSPPRWETVPVFLNPAAGRADQMRAALVGAGAFPVLDLPRANPQEALREAVRRGARRIVVAGGDGTISAAAAALAGTSTELAIVPGGTLNHFARDLGIPTEPDEAVRLARHGVARSVDVGSVNSRIFLNASSFGAYVSFVRRRELLEQFLGYHLASLAAGIRTLAHLRPFRVHVEANGTQRVYETPLVFVGVHERELRIPMLGSRIPHGARGLHVLIPRARTRFGVTVLVFRSLLRDVRSVAATPQLDSFIVNDARVELRRAEGNVALDGELVPMVAPLEYRLERDALRVVVPAEGSAAE